MSPDDEILEISVVFICVFVVIEVTDDVVSETLVVNVCVVSGLAALLTFIDNNETDSVPEFSPIPVV